MHSITSLITKLREDFPEFHFVAGDTFHWLPTEKTVFYDEVSTDTAALLHELAHATLGHTNYTRDIELIEMERDAWSHAQAEYAKRYDIGIDDDLVQDSLDTYRDWLHARSTCPECHAVGIQSNRHRYKCLACGQQWQANDARICGLRRYRLA